MVDASGEFAEIGFAGEVPGVFPFLDGVFCAISTGENVPRGPIVKVVNIAAVRRGRDDAAQFSRVIIAFTSPSALPRSCDLIARDGLRECCLPLLGKAGATHDRRTGKPEA